jgi:hypothetical protein
VIGLTRYNSQAAQQAPDGKDECINEVLNRLRAERKVPLSGLPGFLTLPMHMNSFLKHRVPTLGDLVGASQCAVPSTQLRST